jgi:hypothetical protein
MYNKIRPLRVSTLQVDPIGRLRPRARGAILRSEGWNSRYERECILDTGADH